MFFDDIKQIPEIAKRTSCTIFVVPKDTTINLKHAITLSPAEDKKSGSITIEQMRDFLALTNNRETSDRYFVISPADAMNEAAQNAFLKTLEEPKDFVISFCLLNNQHYYFRLFCLAPKSFSQVHR